MNNSPESLLLLGPTGSGKTPLGEAIAKRGVSGHRAFHFDFGAHLRAVAGSPEKYPLLSTEDITLLSSKLARNALLEDHEFYLAENIIRSFITTNQLQPDDVLILNGIPRHIGQAQAIDSIVKIETVILLECSAEVVLQRISNNTGGDRSDRSDDTRNEIERKLRIFNERTLPLIDFYKQRNISVKKISITGGMTTGEMMKHL